MIESKEKFTDGYIASVEYVIQNLKFTAIFCGAPLLAVASQLRWIQHVDSVVLKIILSFSVLSFIVTGIYCIVFINRLTNYLAIMNYENGKNEHHYGEYIDFMVSLSGGNRDFFSEEKITAATRASVVPVTIIFVLGWLCLVIALLWVLWL